MRFKGVNAGSGERRFPNESGWVNIDISDKVHEGGGPDIVCDMANMPFDDESVDMVVSCHTLEHLPLGGADSFIADAWRVLKVGGVLVVSLPDIRALAKRWLTGQISDYIYTVCMMGPNQGRETDFHRWHYTKEGLWELLDKNGSWTNYRPWIDNNYMNMNLPADWWILTYGAEKSK